MSKPTVVAKIAEATGLSKKDAEKAFDAIGQALTDVVNGGANIRVPGLGSFKSVLKKERSGISPATGERWVKPEHKAIVFKQPK
jgi:DNA-binding protein HU-beta